MGAMDRAVTPKADNPASPVPVDVTAPWRAVMPPPPPFPTTKGQERVMKVAEKTEWNTKHLGQRIGADAASAASAGVLVAPLITTIDRAIIENASGRSTLMRSIGSSLTTLLLRPHNFLLSKPFGLIFMLYMGTYLAANSVDTALATTRNKSASETSHGLGKFSATSTANVALCVYKDSRFTKLFGATGGPPRAVPTLSYALFTMRDCLTVFASFNVPPLLAPHIQKRLSSEWQKSISSASAAQFIAPAAVQIVSTPMHLYGLDLYNRPQAKIVERVRKVVGGWAPSCLARMARIVPAFGVGGVVNASVRKRMLSKLE